MEYPGSKVDERWNDDLLLPWQADDLSWEVKKRDEFKKQRRGNKSRSLVLEPGPRLWRRPPTPSAK
ncbi:hypothetical protein L249_1999 [Ophiocordyceps polyrhachis-furcata BCC 54312]|uniref:Uncharacterized protein n=1 Tax=Ophiocordyceps polyrhachis-furcata BCC 54312 TaxID=1330021 RepID=A0A367LSG0_9HYPO|nr:hypothetical protein L249_1999 [Ophiocordyceps polyrhachis-furcata BCC 54312]